MTVGNSLLPHGKLDFAECRPSDGKTRALEGNKWCPEPESNQRHANFQSAALPTELSGHLFGRYRPSGAFLVGWAGAVQRVWQKNLRGVGRSGPITSRLHPADPGAVTAGLLARPKGYLRTESWAWGAVNPIRSRQLRSRPPWLRPVRQYGRSSPRCPWCDAVCRRDRPYLCLPRRR